MQEETNAVGRPTKYDPSLCDRVKDLCLMGATDAEISEIIEIHIDTFYTWKNKYPEFSDAIKEGKEIADANVVKSLYKRANGFKEDDKYFPPDPTSCIFWLKNRRRHQWRDKQDIEHTGKDGEPLPNSDPMEIARTIAFILNSASKGET